MAEAKVFPMSTFVTCLKGGEADPGLLEMLSFITGANVSKDLAPVAAGLSKAWIYEQNPELTKYSEGEIEALGAKVAIKPLGDTEQAKAQAALAKLAEYKTETEKVAGEKKALEGKVKDLEAEVATLKSKLRTFETQAAQGDQKLQVSMKKMDDAVKKLDDVLAKVEAVKSTGLVVSGDGAAAGAEAAGESGAPASEAGDDFGFTGGGSDPFADSNW